MDSTLKHVSHLFCIKYFRGPEPQVLNYQTVQQRVFPWLATAYAYYFAGMHIRNMYFVVNGEIQEGNVDMLPEVHNLGVIVAIKICVFTLLNEGGRVPLHYKRC